MDIECQAHTDAHNDKKYGNLDQGVGDGQKGSGEGSQGRQSVIGVSGREDIDRDVEGARIFAEVGFPLLSRAKALAAGLSRFFTGKPCRRGHIDERMVSGGACRSCQRETSGTWKSHNREKVRASAHRRWVTSERYRKESLERLRRRYRKKKNEVYQLHRQWYIENRDQVCERRRIKYATDPEARARHLGGHRRWRTVNLEKYRQGKRKWYLANPEKAVASTHRRRARKKAADGIFSKEDIHRIRVLQNNRCAECQKSFEHIKAHVDHIVPLTKGGSNWPRNLQLLCGPCNSCKGARDPIEHARIMGRLL